MLKKHHKDWDAYLVSKLSQMTATWIVHERTTSNQQDELKKVLHGW